jgi:hypothetical protein
MQVTLTGVVISWVVLLVGWEVGRRKFYPKALEFYYKKRSKRKG